MVVRDLEVEVGRHSGLGEHGVKEETRAGGRWDSRDLLSHIISSVLGYKALKSMQAKKPAQI